MATAKPKNGVRFDIGTRWIDASGYRPVLVEAFQWPTGPAPADRIFRIVLRPRNWAPWQGETNVTGYLELPQGATNATTTISVPCRGPWSAIRVDVYEDGLRLEDVSGQTGIPSTSGGWGWSEAAPGILLIDPDMRRLRPTRSSPLGLPSDPQAGNRLPDVRFLVQHLPENPYGNQPASIPTGSDYRDADTWRLLQSLPRVDVLPPEVLPTRWLDYTCFDLIFVSREDFQSLVTQHPEQWRAIRDWLATGPTLCMFDVDLESPQLAELEQLLELPPAARAGPKAPGGWRAPDSTQRTHGIRGLDDVQPNANRSSATAPLGRQPVPRADSARLPFLMRDVELGTVVALRSPEPFAPESPDTVWLFNALGADHWQWYQRHGVSFQRANEDYWKFGIPGVGAAPVNAYLVLITAFVILIGPVNYVVLRRRRRLYLLLVTVPAGAVLIVLTLLTYALVSDGLGVRLRGRSFTLLDQRQGRCVSWARQSYYAGLAPSRGLTFPEDTACYIVEQLPEYERRGKYRSLVWNEGQHLTAGYLASRSTAQFLLVNSRRSQRGLAVQEAGDAAGPPRVTNRLETDLLLLLLCDAQQHYYWATDVAAGQQFQPQPIRPEDARQRLKAAFTAQRPEFPVGYDSRYSDRGFGFGRRYYAYWRSWDQYLSRPSFDQSLLERNLIRAVQQPDLGPRSYAAITRTSPEVPLGYRVVQETASFHLVYGRW
jgi:hypothetical protein